MSGDSSDGSGARVKIGDKLFDDNVAVIRPYAKDDLNSIWQFCVSGQLQTLLRMLDKKMSVTAGTFTKVPFDPAEISSTSFGNSLVEAATNETQSMDIPRPPLWISDVG